MWCDVDPDKVSALQSNDREFIRLFGGAAVAWPLAARGQQPAVALRRIGVFMHFAADDPEGQARIGAFLQGLQEFGWAIGSNVKIDYRWSAVIPSVVADIRRN
jgi:putative ABC transport system substrate-binding protein